MWEVSGNDLKMTEAEFGVALPMTIKGLDITAEDSLRFTIKKVINGAVVLGKDFSGVSDNEVDLIFSEEDSALLSPGTYVYSLDVYRSGQFRLTLVEASKFKVGDKA